MSHGVTHFLYRAGRDGRGRNAIWEIPVETLGRHGKIMPKELPNE